MAKAPASIPEAPAETVPVGSEPKLFTETVAKFGPNQDMWPIWVREEYAQWKAGGAAPSGGLPREYFTKRPAEDDQKTEIV